MAFKKEIVLSSESYAKICNWVDLCSKEISGLGTIEIREDSIYVDQVYLLDQEVTGADTDIDSVAIAKLLGNLPKSSKNRLRFWWHSHVNMGVFWSGTDETCIKALRGEGFILSIVFNKKGEYKARIDFDSEEFHAKFDDLEMYVETPKEVMDEFKQEILDEYGPVEDPIDFAEFYKESLDSFDPQEVVYNQLTNYCKKQMDAKVRHKKVVTSSSYGLSKYYKGKSQYKKGTPYPKVTKQTQWDELDWEGWEDEYVK